jgi:hypothetical protein
MIRTLVCATLLFAMTVAATALATEPRSGFEAEGLLLRVPDIGNGYRVGDDSGCGGLGTENAPSSVAQLTITYRPTGCSIELERLWRASTPPPANGARLIESVAFVFPTADGAAAALRVAGDFARYVLLDPEGLVPASEQIALGEQALVFAESHRFTIVWRKGGVVALVHVNGQSAHKARQTALSLARLQENRIENPTPLPTGANDDREVAIDDPHLPVPVYWLGRRFTPGHGLPRLELTGSEEDLKLDPGLLIAARIDYSGRHGAVALDLWKPRRWARFKSSRYTSDASWRSPCAEKRVIRLPRGHAELFGGYAPRARPIGITPVADAARRCPTGRADEFVAYVYLPRVVIAVNMPLCMRCFGRYESFRALMAVVRSLRPRR